MRTLMTHVRRLAAPAVLALTLAAGAPALAQQPASPPPAQEVELFQQLQGTVAGRVTIPDARAGTLIQPQGKAWRDFWREESKLIGGIAVLGMLAILVAFFLVRGRIRIEGGASGRTITRFNSVERFAHWLTATTFIVLGLTGLNITFGRSLLLPILGPDAFAAVSQFGKYAHNYLSFAFVLGVVLMFVLWVKDNIPNKLDVDWLKAGGGIIGKGHAHARKFNGGQKMIFWSVILGGIALSVSGYILMFPFQFTDMAGMQLSHMVHALVGVIMIAIILAHIYIGSLGMEGAFAAMGSGEVDLNWARAHHDLWVEEMFGRGTGPAPRPHPVAAE